jgi:hypothetical protein
LLIDLAGGTIQGSILGQILYALFGSPLYDLQKLTTFADDNFVVQWNTCMKALICDTEKDLEMMTKWLKDSGLKVNKGKTELWMLHRMDSCPVTITLNQVQIVSVNSMNILGVQFDNKLSWSFQVNNCMKKAMATLHSIRLIKG